GRILANEVVARRLAAFDGPLPDRVGDLERRHDFAGGKGAELELVVGRLGDALGDLFRPAEKSVQALRKARCQAPLEFRLALGASRRRDRAAGKPNAGGLQERASPDSPYPPPGLWSAVGLDGLFRDWPRDGQAL